MLTLVFVHGWSVTNLNTYGNLPQRLKDEGEKNGLTIEIEEIYLGQYISFHDEVKLPDISRAFAAALVNKLAALIQAGKRFVCITHSTGGPVIRDWWSRYYYRTKSISSCPMSHLIMLAPANFGSALAQLGKSTLSRIKSLLYGVQPGQGVLDWLALGSAEAWTLNKEWIQMDGSQIGVQGIFPFVIMGQSIERKFYDVLNSYTGELGSDGVVRIAAANLEAAYIKLVQRVPIKDAHGNLITFDLIVDEEETKFAPAVPLRLIHHKSHSGTDMGIMGSVGLNDEQSMETVTAILECIQVQSNFDYNNLRAKFEVETKQVQSDELIEISGLLENRKFIHSRYCMLIFRVFDTEGYPIIDYDLILTTGVDNDPNNLPEGFYKDRQQNKKNPESVTYFIDYDVMQKINTLGIIINPRPDTGFVRYLGSIYKADKDLFDKILNPNTTTMIDISIQRLVDKNVFQLINPQIIEKDFSQIRTSNEIAI